MMSCPGVAALGVLTGHDTPTRAKCTGSNHLPLQLYRGGQVRLR